MFPLHVAQFLHGPRCAVEEFGIEVCDASEENLTVHVLTPGFPGSLLDCIYDVYKQVSVDGNFLCEFFSVFPVSGSWHFSHLVKVCSSTLSRLL